MIMQISMSSLRGVIMSCFTGTVKLICTNITWVVYYRKQNAIRTCPMFDMLTISNHHFPQCKRYVWPLVAESVDNQYVTFAAINAKIGSRCQGKAVFSTRQAGLVSLRWLPASTTIYSAIVVHLLIDLEKSKSFLNANANSNAWLRLK